MWLDTLDSMAHKAHYDYSSYLRAKQRLPYGR